MLTREERNRLRGEMVTELRQVQRYNQQDFANKYAIDEFELRKLLWEAKQVVFLEDGVEFGPVRGWSGEYERKEWDQIERRAQRQRRRGTRAHKRAEARLRQAAIMAPDAEKERLNDAADRVALRLAMQAAKA